VTLAAGLLALALLLPQKPPPQRPMYQWRDAGGQVHVTNTPPPPGAELVEAPPPQPAVELGPPEPPFRPKATRIDRRRGELSSAQQAAWQALEEHLAKARARHDRSTLEAVTDSLIDDCLWGSGLWAVILLPVLSVALMGLLGWWLALGLQPGTRIPIVAGFLVLGVAFGQLLLASFLYHPQALRLRQNMELLEVHAGRKDVRPANHTHLVERYRALEDASDPLQPPWRFPLQVAALRRDMKQVMVDP
jgi:hypothetical protein